MAIQDYEEAIRLDPHDAPPYYNRGVAYGEFGKSDEAARDFAKAKELGFEAPRLYCPERQGYAGWSET